MAGRIRILGASSRNLKYPTYMAVLGRIGAAGILTCLEALSYEPVRRRLVWPLQLLAVKVCTIKTVSRAEVGYAVAG